MKPSTLRQCLSPVALGFLVLLVSGADADQRDQRLELLFEELRSAPSADAASGVESQVWRIWLQSEDPEVNLMMAAGMRAMQINDSDRALEIFDQVVERAPDFAEGWNKRATVYWIRDEYDASMRDIQQTLRLEPRHFGAISGMGLIFEELEDPEAALQAFEEVLRIHPHAPGARSHVELLRRELKNRVL
jgi:tetratricopeptide (TPR) repeat protein